MATVTPSQDKLAQQSSVDKSWDELADEPSSLACISDINHVVMSEKAGLEKMAIAQK